MAVVTISRRMGSNGGRVARAVAEELGYTFADRKLIDRVIRKYGLTRLEELHETRPSIWELFDQDNTLAIDMMDRTIAALARRGDVVILGRGGYAVLADMADVLNVSVTAPLDVRVERIMRRRGVDRLAAEGRIKADDDMRERFVRLFYGKEWIGDEKFDLLVDTGQLSDEEACQKIVSAVAAMKQPAAGARVASSFEVDSVLDEAIQEALDF